MPDYHSNTFNDSEEYYELIKSKGLDRLIQSRTKDLKGEIEKVRTANIARHVWRYGDTMFKISFMYYGRYDKWYFIALRNLKPTDSHYVVGQTIFVPLI